MVIGLCADIHGYEIVSRRVLGLLPSAAITRGVGVTYSLASSQKVWSRSADGVLQYLCNLAWDFAAATYLNRRTSVMKDVKMRLDPSKCVNQA